MIFNWEKLGLLLKPSSDIKWMVSHTGSSFPVSKGDNIFDLFITGRDKKNRSSIGVAKLDLNSKPKILSIEKEPILSRGPLGAFDENGVSYPHLVDNKNKIFMYYTGWSPGSLVPFHNQLGLAIIKNKSINRFSNAPILHRNNQDYISIGGVCVLKEQKEWKMWYTSFLKWEKLSEKNFKHYYNIKFAKSLDGVNWERKNEVVIDFKDSSEYAICRPSVIFKNGLYHMVFCYKGKSYKLGYAISEDGIVWRRLDSKINIKLSSTGWDSEEMCYPCLFIHNDYIYLIYAGNNYGDAGIGIARSRI